MKIKPLVTGLFAAIVAASACAQSAPQPLNLNLPPEPTPRASAAPAPGNKENSAAAASTVTDATNPAAGPAQMQPGVHYDDPDGVTENLETSAAPNCDDAKYSQPQVHGSTTVGVVGGNHISGNYQSAVVSASKAFGSCDHPTGGASISIGVGQENLNGRRHGGH